MKPIHDWALRHRIPLHMVADLMQSLGAGFNSPQGDYNIGVSESAVQSNARLEAAKNGAIMWRNNVGVLPDQTGRPVRYGLCNDSAKLNKHIKSGDLIGITPILITTAHVGFTIGQFTSRECKPGGWHYTGTEREAAQLKWIETVIAKGGSASFITGEGLFK